MNVYNLFSALTCLGCFILMAKCDIDIRQETDPKILIALLESQMNFTSALIKRLSFLFKTSEEPNIANSCRWVKISGKVLREINEGRAFEPDFNHLFSIQCPDVINCQIICEELSCNYIVRSKFDGLSHAYSLTNEIVFGKQRLDNSVGYDSYRRDCSTSGTILNPAENNPVVSSARGQKTEDECRWRKVTGKVLTEISEGRAFPPDIVYHRSVRCGDIIQCQAICVSSSCNYIVRSKFDGITHMYTVIDEKLHSKHLDHSTGYDSFARICAEVHDNKETCHWEKLEGNVLNEINEGKAFQPDFMYHRSAQCSNFKDCQSMCNRTACNYMVRSKFDGLTHMFLVSQQVLQLKQVNDSKGYDSFMQNCTEKSTPPPINLNCKWNKMNGQVLMEISEGRDFPPDFTYHTSAMCSHFNNCQAMCDEMSCNYIVRSKFNGLSHMYVVVQSKLHSEYVANSTGYDSYTKDCSSGYDASPPPIDKQYVGNKYGANDYNKPYNPYQTAEEESEAEKNFKLIDQLNLERIDEDDAFFGPNKFNNFSHGSFLEQFTGLRINETEEHSNETEFPEEAFGATCKRLNWNEFGVISEVRDQRECGACYAFTSMDLIASQYSIDRSLWNQSYVLSPQFILDCLGSPNGFGCGGGRPLNVIRELANRKTIIPKESCYPYKGRVGECSIPTCEVLDPDEEELSVKWAQLVNLSGKKEKDKIADLLRWGPMITFIDASLAWQFYNGSGIIKAHHCQQISNHAVLLVGYNYEEGRTPYYIIKNSWGVDYGDEGYVKLEAGKNACNVAQNLVVTCTSNCEKLRSVKNLIKRPHSTGCIEIKSAIAANANTTIFA